MAKTTKTTKKTSAKAASNTKAPAKKKAVAKKAAPRKTAATKATAKKTAVKKKAATAKTTRKAPVNSVAAGKTKVIQQITAGERHTMIAEAAYLRGEAMGFLSDEREDWFMAEVEIDERLSKAGIEVTA